MVALFAGSASISVLTGRSSNVLERKASVSYCQVVSISHPRRCLISRPFKSSELQSRVLQDLTRPTRFEIQNRNGMERTDVLTQSVFAKEAMT